MTNTNMIYAHNSNIPQQKKAQSLQPMSNNKSPCPSKQKNVPLTETRQTQLHRKLKQATPSSTATEYHQIHHQIPPTDRRCQPRELHNSTTVVWAPTRVVCRHKNGILEMLSTSELHHDPTGDLTSCLPLRPTACQLLPAEQLFLWAPT